MSRITYYYEEEDDEQVIVTDGCKYKVNGKCYCNSDWRKLGKKCFSEGICTHFLMERRRR